MEDFVEYLLKEFNLPQEVVCNRVDFAFTQKNDIDKISKVPITHNIINVRIDCFDKNHHRLRGISERFVDGKILRPKTRKLINISPDELNNKFNAAKPYICAELKKKNSDRVKELNEVISDLSQYCQNMSIIPNEFISEPKISKAEDDVPPPQLKSRFEF